jgi:hypothetical protein
MIMTYQGETKDGAFRVDVVDYGTVKMASPTWASNGLRFDTAENAAKYASDLSGRWLALAAYRVVPADTPQREPYKPEDADRVWGKSG